MARLNKDRLEAVIFLGGRRALFLKITFEIYGTTQGLCWPFGKLQADTQINLGYHGGKSSDQR